MNLDAIHKEVFKQSMHVVIFFEQHFELTNQALFIEIWNVS